MTAFHQGLSTLADRSRVSGQNVELNGQAVASVVRMFGSCRCWARRWRFLARVGRRFSCRSDIGARARPTA
jgi:hypothetical protein